MFMFKVRQHPGACVEVSRQLSGVSSLLHHVDPGAQTYWPLLYQYIKQEERFVNVTTNVVFLSFWPVGDRVSLCSPS